MVVIKHRLCVLELGLVVTGVHPLPLRTGNRLFEPLHCLGHHFNRQELIRSYALHKNRFLADRQRHTPLLGLDLGCITGDLSDRNRP